MTDDIDVAKAISPCDKEQVKIDELVRCCQFVKECNLISKRKIMEKIMLSFSVNELNGLNYCIWKRLEDETLECVIRIGTDSITLMGAVGLARLMIKEL